MTDSSSGANKFVCTVILQHEKIIFVLSLCLSGEAFSQFNCKEFYNTLDSIHLYNQELVKRKDDTAGVKTLIQSKYRNLSLYGSEKPLQPVSGFLFFSVDRSLLAAIHLCIMDKANENGWFSVVSPPEADGFRRLNIYDSKKKKQRILFYAVNPLDNTKIKIGISIYWQ